jgi:hypothetical protein
MKRKLGGRRAQPKRAPKETKADADDEGNTSFELPDSYFEEQKPGFKPAAKAQIVPKGDRQFPRITPEKDVPQASLAERVRKAR